MLIPRTPDLASQRLRQPTDAYKRRILTSRSTFLFYYSGKFDSKKFHLETTWLSTTCMHLLCLNKNSHQVPPWPLWRKPRHQAHQVITPLVHTRMVASDIVWVDQSSFIKNARSGSAHPPTVFSSFNQNLSDVFFFFFPPAELSAFG